MTRGGHGLPKVSPGPALPYPSTPCRRATPERALWPFLGCPTLRVGGLQQSSSLLDTPRHTSMITIRFFRSFFRNLLFMWELRILPNFGHHQENFRFHNWYQTSIAWNRSMKIKRYFRDIVFWRHISVYCGLVNIHASIRRRKNSNSRLTQHRMPRRLSRYKKYRIAGTKIYDNIPLGAWFKPQH